MATVSALARDSAYQVATPVVGVVQSPDGPQLVTAADGVDAALGGRLGAALRAAGATGKPDEVVRIPTLGLAPFPVIVAAGLGRIDGEPSAEQVRRAAGAALRSVTGLAARDVRLAVADEQFAGAAAEGALLGGYAFTRYKSSAPPSALRRISVHGDVTIRAALRRATVVAEQVNSARDLVNLPGNDLYPQTFAERVAELGAAAGLAVEILDERALRRGRYGGILAVGAGSARPPRLVRITYRGARPRAHVALVGKGITFDSGGLNLKTQMMSWWKADMAGGAAAVGAVLAAARLRLPIQVSATVPMAENMPSGTAYRPSDILVLRGGRTVEVADTDAEGRLVLADAITRSLEDKPDCLIETSTLTGGQMVALGMRVIGAMGEPGLRDRVTAAGNAAGEAVWAMPLPEYLRPGLDSPVADLVNVPAERWGSMLVGGLFLAEFMPAGLPWVHLDIAGPAWNNTGPYGYTPKGGTGAAVRTLVAALEDLAG